jgi:MFS family permease
MTTVSESQNTNSIRLRPIEEVPIEDEILRLDVSTTEHASTQRLPPVDGGHAAWLFAGGCCTIEMILWGFPFSFGVLQEHYATHPPFSQNSGSLAAVGTTCTGIMYLYAPINFLHFSISRHARRYSMFYALPLLSLSLIASSYATTVTHLILTQGIAYALCGCYLYYPVFLYVDEWFVRRKALAYGIMWVGSGLGGLVGPFVLSWGLNRYGAPLFLRGWGIGMLILIGPFLFFVRPRLPDSHLPNTTPTLSSLRHSYSFLRTPEFTLIQTANFLQGLGYFIPLLYLPTYAASVSLSTSTQSLLLSLTNLSAIPGLLFLTTLADRSTSVYTLILISTLGSALAVFFFWGFASNHVPMLVVFTVLYGLCGGGFTAVYAATAKEIRNVMTARYGGTSGADIGSIFGLLGVGRGIGNVIAGPLSEVLLKGASGMGTYGSGYGPLVVFTGGTAVAATVAAGLRWAGGWQRRL